MSETAIVAEALTKHYGAVTAVDGIDFEVPGDRVTALLGGNGAGKTTTLAMLLGLLAVSSGRITILGEDVVRHRYRVLGRMNFSSPYVELPHRLTVGENLLVYARLYNVPAARQRVADILADLDLTPFTDRPAGKLSAGQKTRVALAKALINRPEVLLLDEPTASLDPDTADWVRSYLERYQTETGAAILLASHNMTEVERLADKVLMMKAGKIVSEGSPRELLDRFGRETLEEVFLDVARAGRGRAAAHDSDRRDAAP